MYSNKGIAYRLNIFNPFTPSPLHPFTPSPLHPFTPSPLHIMQTLTQELREKIENHIRFTDLYYVDYRDELSTENMQSIIKSG